MGRRGASKRLREERSGERRASVRFPVTLALRYDVSGGDLPGETGTGHTIELSSSGLSFTADRPLLIGQNLNLSIDWPVVLDGEVRLQLIARAVVVRTDGTVTAVKIQNHELKTRRDGSHQQPEITRGGLEKQFCLDSNDAGNIKSVNASGVERGTMALFATFNVRNGSCLPLHSKEFIKVINQLGK